MIWSEPTDQQVAKANTVWGDDLEHPYGEIPLEQRQANANLIAAAPDLFEVVAAFALNRRSLRTEEPFEGALGKLLDMADAALAKARGEA